MALFVRRSVSFSAMEGGAANLLLHLLKIPATVTEEDLAHVLETLWSTRSTGLSSLQKRDLQSRLGLASTGELEPVLACLRSIIRKSGRQNLSRDDIQRFFPVDLPVELQSSLLVLLQRYQSEWKENASRDQPLWQQTRVSHQATVSTSPAFAPFTSSENLSSIWPRKDDVTTCYNNSRIYPAPAGGPDLPHMASVPLPLDGGLPNNKGNLPCLKSMTWTIENRHSGPSDRVAVICLKLQDYTKSPLGEVEVKFQLSRDTLEAMLRSMTYINDQLSNSNG